MWYVLHVCDICVLVIKNAGAHMPDWTPGCQKKTLGADFCLWLCFEPESPSHHLKTQMSLAVSFGTFFRLYSHPIIGTLRFTDVFYCTWYHVGSRNLSSGTHPCMVRALHRHSSPQPNSFYIHNLNNQCIGT